MCNKVSVLKWADTGAITGGAWHPGMMLSSTSWRRAWHPLGKGVESRPRTGRKRVANSEDR